jgi:nucleotide-binding universal stress UspA family protein
VKILLAADGSKHTQRAVNYLLKHRDSLGSKPEIHLLHVRPPLPNRAAAALGRRIVQRYHAEQTRKALAPAKRALDRAKVGYKEVRMVGDAGALIASYASKGKFSLVVMGSRGHGTLGSLLLGSVASKVLANCRVPALIIR